MLPQFETVLTYELSIRCFAALSISTKSGNHPPIGITHGLFSQASAPAKSKVDTHVKSPFYMDLGIQGFRNSELL